MSFKNLFCIVFLLICSLSLNAATYYVSTTGNDTSGTGTISSPWKTITKGQSQLSAGDTLLVRGGTYYESVTITVQGTQTGRITIKAYPGETPVLDGRSVITGWTRCAANEPGLTVAGKTNVNATSIYKADIDTSDFTTSGLWWMLYEDGAHSFLCRWPEQSEGYGVDPTEFQDVPTESVSTTTTLKDDSVLNPASSSSIWYPYINGLNSTQLASYWNDSYIQIWFKNGANATGTYSITGYSNNEITTGTLRRALLTGDKYCFYRHAHLVNKPGKFYFSPTPVNGYQTFYFWPTNTANLNGKITIATKSKGFYASNKDYITIEGFKVVGFQDVGIHFINATSTSPIVKNCTVEDCGESGIYIQNATQVIVDSCMVNRVGDRGIFINGGTDCIIKNSTAKDNRGTCISMYNVEYGQITDNTIYDARGVHVNGVSCYMGCNKMLIARNRFAPGVNLAMQNIADVCLFGNIMDGGGESKNLLTTWVDTTNSNQATRGYQVYLQNTLVNSASPYSMLDFCSRSGSFTNAAIDNDGGKVRLNSAGCFTSTQFKYTGTYGLMIYCDFSNNTYADGWYESIANTADTCTINLAYVSSTPTASGQCGGQSTNYLYNNLIGGCGEWELNVAGRSHNWWIPKTYGSTYATPTPPLAGEIYTSYSERTTALNSCFTDLTNQDYSLKTGSSAIGAGMPMAAINAILDDTTIGDSGTSIRQNFPDFDFTKDIAGRTWAATPSIGANEYASSGPVTSYTLTIAAANGTVSKKVAGIATTATSFPAGTVVELTAAANSGYAFSSWTGSATGTTNPVSVTVNANKSVTANFVQISTTTYTLSITATNGTVTKKVAGVATTATSFAAGTVVELTAAANSGYAFGSWTGSATGTTNPVSVTMNANKAVTANFTQIITTYTLSITATSGTVTKKVAGVATTATSFAAGTLVELTATTISGYTFSSWTGSATGTTNPVSVTMNANKAVTANFTQDITIYTLSITATSGTVTKKVAGVTTTATSFATGTVVELTAVANSGYAFSSWTGSATGTTNPVSVTMNGNKTVTVNFTTLSPDLSMTAHWMLDENTGTTATDSGNTYTATLINSPSWGFAWADEDWVSLDKQTQAITIPANALLPQAGSIVIWVEPDNLSGTQFLLGHVFNNSNRINLYSVAGKLALGLGTNVALKTNIADLTVGQPAHVALTWNGTSYAVYVNSIQKATGTFEGLTTLNTTLDVGNYGDPANRTVGFIGVVEDIRTYCRALTATEIQRLYYTYDVFQQKSLSFSIQTVDSNGLTVTFQPASTLPAGATFESGVFSWQPWYNQVGNYTIVFSATGQTIRIVTITVHSAQLTDWYRQFLVYSDKLQ